MLNTPMFKIVDWQGREVRPGSLDFLCDADAISETDYVRTICKIVEV